MVIIKKKVAVKGGKTLIISATIMIALVNSGTTAIIIRIGTAVKTITIKNVTIKGEKTVIGAPIASPATLLIIIVIIVSTISPKTIIIPITAVKAIIIKNPAKVRGRNTVMISPTGSQAIKIELVAVTTTTTTIIMKSTAA